MAVPLMFQPLVKYVQFEGRSRRSEFWLWVLFRFLLNRFIGALAFAFIGPSMMQFGMHPADYAGNPDAFLHAYMQSMSPWFHLMPFISLVGLALWLPTLAVEVRRLHDINRTGWWVILPYVITGIGVIVFFIASGSTLFAALAAHPKGDMSGADGLKLVFGVVGSALLFILLPCLIAWIIMLVFYVTEGTKGPNRFGPDPKAVSPTGGF
jgi:uncharacterized membrane protein YhaH (DUF805 family)